MIFKCLWFEAVFFVWDMRLEIFVNKYFLFNTEESKNGFLPLSYSAYLFKNIYPQTPKKRDKVDCVPYTSTIKLMIYVMLYTWIDII